MSRPNSSLGALALAGLAAATLAAPVGAATKDPDGRYRGSLTADLAIDSGPVSFKVSRDGRRLSGWKATFTAVCNYDPYVMTVTVTLPTTTIKRDGRFRGAVRTTRDGKPLKLTVSGRLRGTRVTGGVIDYDIGACTRKNPWTAKRTGR